MDGFFQVLKWQGVNTRTKELVMSPATISSPIAAASSGPLMSSWRVKLLFRSIAFIRPRTIEKMPRLICFGSI